MCWNVDYVNVIHVNGMENLLLLVIDAEKLGCQACNSFNIAKENLFENLDKEGKDYLENFIKAFLILSNETLRERFPVTKVTLPRPQNYNVKSYHKSEKCRSQVVYKNLDECQKIKYTVKGQKRSYYKKFWFYI